MPEKTPQEIRAEKVAEQKFAVLHEANLREQAKPLPAEQVILHQYGETNGRKLLDAAHAYVKRQGYSEDDLVERQLSYLGNPPYDPSRRRDGSYMPAYLEWRERMLDGDHGAHAMVMDFANQERKIVAREEKDRQKIVEAAYKMAGGEPYRHPAEDL